MSAVAKKEPWRIGGPGTLLPRPLESFLSWSLAIGCLSVSGYHYLKATFLFPALAKLQQSMRLRLTASSQKQQDKNNIYVPLTTCSRTELGRVTPAERLEQLLHVLTHVTRQDFWSDEMLVDAIRSNEMLRRLASLAMRGAPSTSSTITTTTKTHLLREQLERLWPKLLVLPPQSFKNEFPFDISLILPAHGERGIDLLHKLNKAQLGCLHPDRVEVIVVDAGGNDDLNVITNDADHQAWGSFQILSFTSGGGRGPCLNFGAQQARGRHYCFCHSDTTLPHEWDVRILEALDDTNTTVRANACAFSFGIDTSPHALHSNRPPPGIWAVITTANWRTHLYSLPYGDQVLSVPAVVFRYLGGFPDQCLMEDYELVSLLRRRAAATQWQKERLVILGGAPALCSPRRWEKFGVLFVTFMNSKFVNLYAGGLSPDDLYRKYYGKEPPARSNELAPWEVSSSFSNSQQGGCIIMMDPIDQDLDLAQGLTVDT